MQNIILQYAFYIYLIYDFSDVSHHFPLKISSKLAFLQLKENTVDKARFEKYKKKVEILMSTLKTEQVVSAELGKQVKEVNINYLFLLIGC